MPTKKSKLRRHLMNGGMKKVNKDISSWDAVNNMINTPGATLKAIALYSLSGFIFLLTIPDDAPHEFLDIPIGGPLRFSKPVRNLLFKFVIIKEQVTTADGEIMTSLLSPPLVFKDDFGKDVSIDKKSETLLSMMEECTVQQDIYLKTLTPNGLPICPSVTDFSIFSNYKLNILPLLKKLRDLTLKDVSSITALNYLRTQCEKDTRKDIGLLTMAYVGNSKPLALYNEIASMVFSTQIDRFDSVDSFNALPEVFEYNYFSFYSIALYVLLFLKTGRVPLDCHSCNILAIHAGRYKMSTLIDFGRMLQLFNDNIPIEDFKYKEEYNQISNFDQDFDSIKEIMKLSLSDIISNEQKLKQIILFMLTIDYSYNFSSEKEINYPQAIALLEFLVSTVVADEDVQFKDGLKPLSSEQNVRLDAKLINVKVILETLTEQKDTDSEFTKENVAALAKTNLLYQFDEYNAENIYRSFVPNSSKGGMKIKKKTLKKYKRKFNVKKY